nr:FCD domain-containing protein [Pseudochelatococcus lubricantis]
MADGIAEHLELLILEGVLRPGERLVSERELAERLEVSRPSLRDALDILEKRGLVVTTKGGTFVAQFLAPLIDPLAGLLQSSDRALDDYFEFRQLIDAAAARMAAARATDVDRAEISACIARMKSAHDVAVPQPETEAAVDAELHLLVYEAAHNLVVLHVMRTFADMLRRDILFNRARLYTRAGVRDALLAQHEAIADAILAGDSGRAETLARDHIRFTHESLLAVRRDERRLNVALRRLGRRDIVSS